MLLFLFISGGIRSRWAVQTTVDDSLRMLTKGCDRSRGATIGERCHILYFSATEEYDKSRLSLSANPQCKPRRQTTIEFYFFRKTSVIYSAGFTV